MIDIKSTEQNSKDFELSETTGDVCALDGRLWTENELRLANSVGGPYLVVMNRVDHSQRY